MLRPTLKWLLAISLGLPVLQTLLFWVAGLLAAMGDAGGAAAIRRVNLAAAVVWLIALVALVLLLAMKAVNESGDLRDELDEPPL